MSWLNQDRALLVISVYSYRTIPYLCAHVGRLKTQLEQTEATNAAAQSAADSELRSLQSALAAARDELASRPSISVTKESLETGVARLDAERTAREAASWHAIAVALQKIAGATVQLTDSIPSSTPIYAQVRMRWFVYMQSVHSVMQMSRLLTERMSLFTRLNKQLAASDRAAAFATVHEFFVMEERIAAVVAPQYASLPTILFAPYSLSR